MNLTTTPKGWRWLGAQTMTSKEQDLCFGQLGTLPKKLDECPYALDPPAPFPGATTLKTYTS